MVLTEAFAAGTPVVASDIAGYRDVVRDGVDGVLVPPGDAQALAETLRDLWDEPDRRAEMARAAAADVERFAWPHVADEVIERLRGCDRDARPVRHLGRGQRCASEPVRPMASRTFPPAACRASSRCPKAAAAPR